MNPVKIFLEPLRQKSLLIILIKTETSSAFAKKKTIFAVFMQSAAALAERAGRAKNEIPFYFSIFSSTLESFFNVTGFRSTAENSCCGKLLDASTSAVTATIFMCADSGRA